MKTGNHTVCRTLVALALAALCRADAREVALFLTGGQSNTDGRVENRDLPDYLKVNELARVCAQSPLDEAKLGTFAAFAPTGKWAYDAELYYLIGQALQTPFYVAKTSYGGTSINPKVSNSPSGHPNAWLPDYGAGYHWSTDPAFLAATVSAGRTFEKDGVVYDGQSMLKAWIENIDAAIDAIRAQGDTPKVKAIIWHQGESDKHSGDYAKLLTDVVTFVRNHVAAKLGDDSYKSLPFFCGSIPRRSSLHTGTTDRAFQTIESTAGNNMHVVDLYDLTLKRDNIHFDAAGAILFGRRLYNRMVDEGVIAGAKVAVANCVRRPDFGAEFIVNRTTTWTWADGAGAIAAAVMPVDGFYFHAQDSHARKVQYAATRAVPLGWTIGETTPTTVEKGAYSNFGDSGGRLSSGTTAGDGNKKLAYMAAVNVGRAGRFEAFYVAKKSASARLYLNGKVVDTKDAPAGDLVRLAGRNEGPGVYYLGLGSGTLLGARFVPDVELPEVTLTVGPSGWGTFGNLHESNFALPDGVRAYAVLPDKGKVSRLLLAEVAALNSGVAVVVKGAPGTYSLVPGLGTKPVGGNLMTAQVETGKLEPTSGKDFFNFVSRVDADGALVFVRADGSQTLAAGEAYFSITEGDAHAQQPTLSVRLP